MICADAEKRGRQRGGFDKLNHRRMKLCTDAEIRDKGLGIARQDTMSDHIKDTISNHILIKTKHL